MRIFLTGATGFIGAHVAETLEQKHEILALTRNSVPNLNTVSGSLDRLEGIKETVKHFKPDAIVHMGWEGIPDYGYSMSRKNLIYGLDILELCEYTDCETVLFTGSCWEYKNPVGRISERHELSYNNSFKIAKNAVHGMAEAFCTEKSINLYWTRLFYVYGSRQKETSVIPSTIKSFKEGTLPDIRTPHNKNDFVHVKTVARVIEAVLEHKPKQSTINIGSGKSTAIIDVLKIISKQLGVSVDFNTYPKPTGNEVDFYADTTIMDGLGIKDYSLERGITEVIKQNYAI